MLWHRRGIPSIRTAAVNREPSCSREFAAADWTAILHGERPSSTRRERTASRRRCDAVRRRFRALLAICVVSAVAGVTVFVWVGVSRGISQRASAAAVAQARTDAARTRASYHERVVHARAYNEQIAATPQVIGEVLSEEGVADGDFTFDEDREYWRALDMGDSIMALLRIPKIGLELPIRHGAGEYALSNGLGHLHGTSLPVGGASTHAVVTGHRGLADRELFTRLDELVVGDPFYVELADGEILGYRVERVLETDPKDTDRLRIERGRDQVTLVTCTPIMLNTRRLLVTGIRADMPDIVPLPDSAPADRRPKTASAAVSGTFMATGWAAVSIRGARRRATGRCRHGRID
ncbi:class C sortase [Bifidobacterium aerophilum]|nr:class C sortase [Bifidobacterium aerophilum]